MPEPDPLQPSLNSRPLHIEILHDEAKWGTPSFLSKAEQICTFAFEKADKPDILKNFDTFEVCITLADNATVQELNKNYRQKDKPTNVLSFPQYRSKDEISFMPEDEPFMLGDIILAYETVAKEATEQSKTFENHTLHLILHGFLHLLEYDHMEEEDALLMETLETDILSSFDIPNPYETSLTIKALV